MRDNHKYEIEISQISGPETGRRSSGFRAVIIVGALVIAPGALFLVHVVKNNPVSHRDDPPIVPPPAFARRDPPLEEKTPPLRPLPDATGVDLAAPAEERSPPAPHPNIEINEIMPGSPLGGDDEFIELWNGSDFEADLTGWSIKKKRSGGGSESVLVASGRFSGITMPPRSYLLLGSDGGYRGNVPLGVRWPHSGTLAGKDNVLLLHDPEGALVDEVAWEEIPQGGSAERGAEGAFTLIDVPTPGRGARH